MTSTAPFGLVLGCLYLAGARRTGARLAEHCFIVFTILVAGLSTLALAAIFVGPVLDWEDRAEESPTPGPSMVARMRAR